MKYWLLMLMLLPGVASATAYKCRDGNGGTAYSTTPCEDNPGLVPYVEDHADQGGKLAVHMDASRNYRIPGTINGSPVTFVLDPGGASRTAISENAAAGAGIQCDAAGHRAATHGAARRCSVLVHEISFGGFEMDNVLVDVVPDIDGDARLGKDVLKRLHVQQAGGTLYISRR